MTVSVAMCTHNGARFLQEQLSSVAAQTMLPVELVICDDQSTDDTARIIASFARSAPFEVRIVYNPRRLGTTQNFEKAMSLCRGRYIALADQDDVWNPDKLNHCVRVLENDETLGGVFSDADLIGEHSEMLGKRLWSRVSFRPRRARLDSLELVPLLLRQDFVTGATVVFRSETCEYALPIPGSWVHDGWLAWILVLYSSLGFIREPLMKYRIHGAQQIGLGRSSLRERLRATCQAGNRQYEAVAQRFEDLRVRLYEHPVHHESTALLSLLEKKTRLLHFQADLATNRLARACQIVTVLPSYLRYTRGVITVCRDLLA